MEHYLHLRFQTRASFGRLSTTTDPHKKLVLVFLLEMVFVLFSDWSLGTVVLLNKENIN